MAMDFKPEEAVSEGERRFEVYRKTISLFLGPVVGLVLFFIPMPSLSTEAHRLSAILGLVLIYWIGEPVPIPITALLGPLLCVMAGVAKAQTVFAPFAHPIIFLFIGSFMLAEAMKAHRLDYRLSLGILAIPGVGDSHLALFAAMAFVPAAISMWISDSATTAMVYPITLGVITAIERISGGVKARFQTGLLLTISYSALIGGIGTPIGTPPNLIGVGMIDRLAGVKIPFFVWMVMAAPIMIAMFLAMVAYMFWVYGSRQRSLPGLKGFISEGAAGLGPWTTGQKNTLFAFLTAVLLWVLPGVSLTALGPDSGVYRFLDANLHEEAVSLIAVVMLFVMPVDWKERRFTLSWAEAANIDWGTILLFGGGLSLGALMFSTGLAGAFGAVVIHATGVDTLWSITAVAVALSIMITEVTSNTATANMLVPLMISVATVARVSPVPPAIGVCLGASMAFMLPVSTPSNAIVYGSGRVPVSAMIKAGIALDIISFIVILAGLYVMCPLLGLM